MFDKRVFSAFFYLFLKRYFGNILKAPHSFGIPPLRSVLLLVYVRVGKMQDYICAEILLFRFFVKHINGFSFLLYKYHIVFK